MEKMPVLFIGHGTPMNAIEDNSYVRAWEKIARSIRRPDVILSVSAHWTTKGTRVNTAQHPRMVYDMYGFPDALYQVAYPAPGAPQAARLAAKMLSRKVRTDHTWGLDHGTWAVLCRMYPDAEIPVFQLSIDQTASAEEHYRIGTELGSLREQGVLILGSGNVVHNLAQVDFDMQGGYPWAEEFNGYIRDKILQRRYDEVIHYQLAGRSAEQAFYTAEHFYPLLYVLGASQQEDRLTIVNDSCTMGALSMTSYVFE